MIPGIDPMTLMMLASGANPGGAGDPLTGAMGGQMMPTAPMANPTAPTAPQAPGSDMSLGSILGSVKAPQGADPKFSGGVSGSGLPYLPGMQDIVSPFLQATQAGQAGQMLPTLGALISQAPGGGR